MKTSSQSGVKPGSDPIATTSRGSPTFTTAVARKNTSFTV